MLGDAGEVVYEEPLQWGKIAQGVNFCYDRQQKSALGQKFCLFCFVCPQNVFFVCFQMAPDI